jgi:hypothetical protein
MGGNEVFYGIQHKWIVTGLEPASFEVERFELGRDACLEVHGRWFGVRGRRFMRPTLTALADGREQRLLAVLDHKPWIAEEGEAWLAAFPWSTDPAALLQAELTVAPDVTVPLPPPSSPAGARRRRAGSSRTALRSSEQELSELDAVKRDCERLRRELREALAARETAIAERHDLIEAEVGLRVADLRAEAQRERAAAGLAAQIARERDAARAERAEAVRERDEAHGERDAARRERNRMLAQRDTARSRADEATRQWEVTAALGSRRTQERDTVADERDRLARERDAIAGERDRLARERDAVVEERDRTARERDAALELRDSTAPERDAAPEERDALHEQTIVRAESAVTQRDPEAPGSARPRTPISAGADAAGRPRRPPAPVKTTAHPVTAREAAAIWRTRILAVGALLVALVFLIVTLATE